MAILASGFAVTLALPAPVQAASHSIVDNPPCTPSGQYMYTTNGATPGEQVLLKECYYGGYWYVQPWCRAQGSQEIPFFSAGVTIRECQVFVWTTSLQYVTYYKFGPLDVDTANNAWTGWWRTPGTIKLSGYYITSEVCASSDYTFDVLYQDWVPYDMGCRQSSYSGPPGS